MAMWQRKTYPPPMPHRLSVRTANVRSLARALATAELGPSMVTRISGLAALLREP